MTTTRTTALIVSGGGYQGLAHYKSLRAMGDVRIVMADCAVENVCRYFVDKFYHVSEVKNAEQYLSELMNICRQEGVDIIFPSTDIEMPLLSENAALFERERIAVAVSSYGILQELLNKRRLYRLLAESQISSLPILDIHDETITYPIIGKPEYGWGGRGCLVFNSREDLRAVNVVELAQRYVWQPLLTNFQEYSVDCAIDFQGRISDLVVRTRVKVIGGYAVISERAEDDHIEELARAFLQIVSKRGACGMFNLQFMRQVDAYYLTDVNPRIGTSSVMSYAVGVDMARFICESVIAQCHRVNTPLFRGARRATVVRYLEEELICDDVREGIQGVVFDLDDTLINQKIWMYDKTVRVYEAMASELPAKRTFLLRAMQYIEEGNRGHLFDALQMEFQMSDALRESLIQLYRKIHPDVCPLYPEVIEVLEGLREKGLRLALLTDNPIESQKQKIECGGLGRYFDRILFSRSLGVEKPHPLTFQHAASQLELRCGTLAYVGDNLYRDILGSLDAGYAYAFWLRRDGATFNFEQQICQSVANKSYDACIIRSLRSLLRSFGEGEVLQYGTRAH